MTSHIVCVKKPLPPQSFQQSIHWISIFSYTTTSNYIDSCILHSFVFRQYFSVMFLWIGLRKSWFGGLREEVFCISEKRRRGLGQFWQESIESSRADRDRWKEGSELYDHVVQTENVQLRTDQGNRRGRCSRWSIQRHVWTGELWNNWTTHHQVIELIDRTGVLYIHNCWICSIFGLLCKDMK